MGELCSLITKGTTPKDKSGNGEVNFVKVENIDTDNGEITSMSKISVEEHEGYLKRSRLEENDILFSIAGTLGRVSVVKPSILPANTNQALAIIRTNKGYIPYLTTVLKGPAVEDFIRKNPTIGAQPNLSLEQVNNLDISYPEYDEQVKIGDYFESLDNLITLHQRNSADFVSRFFSDFTNTWEQRKLSDVATMHARIGWQNLRTSEFLDSGDYMLITGTDFNDGAVNYSTCHFVEKERYEQDKHIQIKNGSILITKDGTLGKVAYVQGLSMPATLNAGVFNVEIKDETKVDNKYLFQYLKAPFLMDYVDKKATGGTIKHLNQNILVDFPVVMPSKAEQEAIGVYFQQLDNLITLHQCEYIFEK